MKQNMEDTKTEEVKRFLSLFFSRKPVIIGAVIITLVFIMAIFAPLIAPYSPVKQDLMNTLAQPSLQHVFGTDSLGRDVFSRIVYGTRISLLVGFASTVIAGFFGMTFGLTAGYLGGIVDNVIMRVMDAMMSIPLLVMALFLGGVLGKGLGNIMLSVGIVMIPGYARLTRGQVLSVKELDYVSSATISGTSRLKNALKHILPNCLSPNLVLMTMNLGMAILVEAGLSFLGMGITPPTPSWGGMVSEGKLYLSTNPVLSITPGIFVILTVWSFNVVGDALRDVFDPRLRGSL